MTSSPRKPELRRRSSWSLRVICFYLSVLCYVIALVRPALYLERNQGALRGLGAWSLGGNLLLVGWLGILFGQYAWFANLPLFAGWAAIYRNQRILAAFWGGVSLVVSSHALELFRTPLPGVESQNDSEILKALGSGYYLWILSMFLVVLGAMLGRSAGATEVATQSDGARRF